MKKPLMIIGFVLVGLLVATLCYVFLNVDVSDILQYSPETPWLAALVLLGLFCLKSVVIIIPLNLLFICAGIMFPMGWALVISLVGLLPEMTIGYYIGKSLRADRVNAIASRYTRLSKLLPGNTDMTASVCFVARFLPFPFDIVSMVQGAYGVKFPRYVFIAYLGTILSIIPFVFVGRHIMTPLSKEFLIPLAVIVLITACPLIIQRVRSEKNASQ
jgi:uncharacterized membrane protein YdjX (TVP38/TMEM64 family)